MKPSDLAGLVAWYDAETLSRTYGDGAAVSSWPDRMGSGLDLLQASPALQPLFRWNAKPGVPMVVFSGAQALTCLSWPDFGDTYTVVIGLRHAPRPAGTDTQMILEASNGAVSTGFFCASAQQGTPLVQRAWNFRGRDAVASIDAFDGDGGLRQDNWVFDGVCDGTSVAVASYKTPVGGAPAAYTAPNPNTLNRLDVGQRPNGTLFYIGGINQIAIYNRACSSAERQGLRAWMQSFMIGDSDGRSRRVRP